MAPPTSAWSTQGSSSRRNGNGRRSNANASRANSTGSRNSAPTASDNQTEYEHPKTTTTDKYTLSVTGVPQDVDFHEVVDAFNRVLRPPEATWKLKFTLQLAPAPPGKENGGYGRIYLDSPKEAKELARRVGKRDVVVNGKVIYFSKTDGSLARATHVHGGFQAPSITEAALQRKRNAEAALRHEIRVMAVEFGIPGRDGYSFSVEWHGDYDPDAPLKPGQRRDINKPSAWLKFNEGREGDNPRSLQVEIGGHSQETMYRITIPMNQIKTMQNAVDFGQHYLVLSLLNPPSFETKPQYAPTTGIRDKDVRNSWKRLTALDVAHERVVAFTSRAIRLILTNDDTHLRNFIAMSKYVGLPRLMQSGHSNILSGDVFSRANLKKYEAMLTKLPWVVAFQCEALVRNCLLETLELLSLEPRITRLVQIGTEFAEEVLKLFVALVAHVTTNKETIHACLDRAETECNLKGSDRSLSKPSLGMFRSRHVLVTPTSWQLEGPYLEQSNRVLRVFGPEYEVYFLRVIFADEGGAMFRQDYEVDNHEFVRERVGGILKSGLRIAFRDFTFLAYSSSGLRQHSVWFMTPFKHPKYGQVDANRIIESLGDFSRVINCPARYGARISQAFSSTDPSLSVTLEEIRKIPDIVTYTEEIYTDGKPKELTWTDGVGTLSPELADQIWARLCMLRSGPPRGVKPRAYQIRLGGFKGVVSVDYRLEGRLICLRPSMDKFDAPDALNIEISEAFTGPSLMHLNRPLIMLLDSLGVKHSAFLALQDDAIEEAQTALDSPDSSALLMQLHALGASYDLPQLLLRLQKYGLADLHKRDPFIRKLLSYSLYHVKRELKYHGRIPVPDSWTLVGIADVHDVLEDGEIFACIRQPDKEPLYLEGPILISRSPTVHPGDVQMVRAVGKPPPGSPYDIEDLANCVIFATKGRRPLPSCVGGGDLDGDLYNLITLPDLHPQKCEYAAAYDAGVKRELERESTMEDVADFVVEYINSDTLGLIATNHLKMADQRPKCVMDPDCLRLAEMHSNAVDYPKTGTPVDFRGIPKPPMKPDWSCGESTDPQNGEFYESSRALGVLFRNVKLSEPEPGPITNPVSQATVVQNALKDRIVQALTGKHVPRIDTHDFEQLFHRYTYELKYQCVTHNLSQSPMGRLAEEEVVLGTILDKTASAGESRKRKGLAERLAKQSKDLVRHVKKELGGAKGEEEKPTVWLSRAWMALGVAYGLVEKNKFGAKSFALLCLSSVLDALDAIEEAEQGLFA